MPPLIRTTQCLSFVNNEHFSQEMPNALSAFRQQPLGNVEILVNIIDILSVDFQHKFWETVPGGCYAFSRPFARIAEDRPDESTGAGGAGRDRFHLFEQD